jgi:amino acid transporter
MIEKKIGVFARFKRALIGKPIPTARAHHERLGPWLGLPVFSSDNLSSNAYATEAILSILVLYSVVALQYQIWITLAITLLIVMIAISYTQTIFAYPKGGGSYTVASENLGEIPGLIAGASLFVDYILTVAVSVAAGVAAIISAFPTLQPYLVELGIGCTLLIAWANLRGLRESGLAFAFPTYGFIIGIFVLVGWGIVKTFGTPIPAHQLVAARDLHENLLGKEANFALWWIVLRAFSAGCIALSGIEAVSNGVPAFRAPESKNAATALKIMVVILAVVFIGLGYISRYVPELTFHTTRTPEYRTLVSQIAAWVSGGDKTWFFYYVQFATAAILILAANTAFADFPRLSSFLARDGYLPRPLNRLGDRLVFHNGIILLAAASCFLIWYFHGELDQLLPLYAVGVFTAFTLSQAGMVRHWFTVKGKGWHHKAVINGIGGGLCLIVLIIVVVTKFADGAWIIAIVIPLLISLFWAIKRRYRAITHQLAISENEVIKRPSRQTSLLLVPRVHRGIISALEYAVLLDPHCRAVHVVINERALPETRRLWEKYGEGIPLTILTSPHRSLTQPILDYVDEMLEEDPDQVITVIVPEAVSTKFWHKLLQENVAQQMRAALGQRQNVMVTNARYFLQ